MAECGNMPDWHPYNAAPGARAAPPSGSQSASTGHMFISSLSPPALDGVNLSTDRHQPTKHQSEASYGRNYVGAPNPGGGCSTSTSLPSGVHMTSLPGCVSHYAGASSTRNPMMDGLAGSMDPRMVPVGGLSEEVAHRTGQMSFPGPTHPGSTGVNVNAGPAGMQNSPVGPMSPGRQAGYGACKAPCCHPDPSIAYQHWDKYGHYHGPPNPPSSYRENIRQGSYPPVDQRRYMPEMNIRKDCIDKDLVESAAFPVEHRRNYDYKYSRKDSVVPRNYPTAANGMLQNYPMQNYNCPNDYQKCPYSVKDYMRRGNSGGPMSSKNSSMLKYQEQQSVIVQQKYSHAKQMQYQNGPASVVMPSASSTGNLPSSLQNSYYNATQIPRDLSRDYPRDYSQEQTGNRMSQATPSSHVHGSFTKYQAYHQKIAMQRYSMENHLRSYSRIPGYQSHPKYQECVMRYRELLRLQQTVDYQSVLPEAPKVPSPTNAVPPVAPINLQFDQNGVLINSNYIPGNYPGLHASMNPAPQTESADSTANSRMTGSGPSMEQRGQFVDHGDQSMNLTRDVDHQSHQGAVVSMHESAESYYMPPGKNSQPASYEVGTLGNAVESLDTLNVDVDGVETSKTTDESATAAPSMPIVSTTSTMDYKNSKDFADKPELDVRQFLATWDESEDEDAAAASVIATSLAERFDDQVFTSKSPTIGTTPEDGTRTTRERNSQEDKNDSGGATSASGASPLTDTTSDIDIGTNESSPINNAERVTITNDIQCIRTDDGDEIPTIHIVDNLEPGTDLEKIHTVFGSLASSVLNPISIGEASSELIGEGGKSETIVLFEQENGVCTKTLEFSVTSEGTGSEVVEGVIASIIESSTVETPDLQKSTETAAKSPYEPPQEAIESASDRLLPVEDAVPTTTSSPTTSSTTSSSSSSKTNVETVDTTSLRKQNSFTSDESHNPDDISLPDLQTSECTPISTTLNTPIHSDSEESSEHVSDLTTSTNPIEIIQNSPIISFTHSPIKIEPYEQLDARMGRPSRQRVAAEQLERHDSLDFDFDREVAVGENTKYTEASETSDTGGVEGLETEVQRTEESILLADIQESPEKNSYSEKSSVEPARENEFYRTADPLVGMAHITETVSEDRGDDVEESRPNEARSDENDETNRDSPVDRILENDDLDTDKCPTMMEPEDDFNRSSDLEKLCDMSLDGSCMMPLISGDECDEPRISVAPTEDGDCFAKMMNDALPSVGLDGSDSSSDERLGKPDEDMWGDVRYVDKHLDASFTNPNDQRESDETESSMNVSKAAKASARSDRSSPTRTRPQCDRIIDDTAQSEVDRRIDLSESEDEDRQTSPETSGETIATAKLQKEKSCSSPYIVQRKSSSGEQKFFECPVEVSRRNGDQSQRRSSRDSKDSEENSRTVESENSQREKSCPSPSIEQRKSLSGERRFEDCPVEESRRNGDSSRRRSSRETRDSEENSRTVDSGDEAKIPPTKSYTTKHRDSNVEIQVANLNVKIHDNEVIRNETVGSKTKGADTSDDGLDAIEIKINVSRGDVNRRNGKQLQEKIVDDDRRVIQDSDVRGGSSPQPRDTVTCSTAKKRCRRRRRSMPDGYEPKRSKRAEDDRPDATDHYTPKKISRGRNGRHKVRRSMDDELLFKPDRSRKEIGTTEERNFHHEMAKAFNLLWSRDETPDTCDSSSSLITKQDNDYPESRNEKKSSTKSKTESRSDKHVRESRTLPSPAYNSTETSSTLDFDNFDVAPHHSSDTDPDKLDSSSEARYVRAKKTRLEDRDRYRNPSSYVTSFDELSSLDAFEINLNTVPIYTTKDGRVTYSPNRNYTYRALIMEARQREGYPAMRKPHCPRHLSSRVHNREAATRKIYKRRQDERSAHEKKKRRSGEYHAGKLKRPASTRHHQDENEPRLPTRPKKHENRRRETRPTSEMSECCSDDQTRGYVDDCPTSKNRSVESSDVCHKPESRPKMIQQQLEESTGTRRPETARKDDQPEVTRNSVSSVKTNGGANNVVEDKLSSPKRYTSRNDNCLVSKIFQGQELEISAREVSSTVDQGRAINEREACVRTSRFFQVSPSLTKTPMASPLINLEKRPIGWDLEQDCQTALSDSGLESSTTYVEASKESRRIQRWKNSFVDKVETSKTIYDTPIEGYTEAIDLSREKLPAEEDRIYFEDEPNDLPIVDNANAERRPVIGSDEINVVETTSFEVEETKRNAERIEIPVETERRRINAESVLPTEPLDDEDFKNDRVSDIVKSLDLAITRRHRPCIKKTRIGPEREVSMSNGDGNDRETAKPAASIFRRDRESARKPSEAPSRRASSDAVESRDSRCEFFRDPTISINSDSKIVRVDTDETKIFGVERIVEVSENADSRTATSDVADRARSPENFQSSCKDFLIDTSTSFSSCMKLPALVSALPTESESSRLEDTSTRFASESMDFKDDGDESDSPRSEFVPFTSHGTIDTSTMDNDTSGRDSFFCIIAENATNPSVDCSTERNSVDSLERYATSDFRGKESSPTAPILSFSGQIQSDSRNSDSLTKSPPNLSRENSVSKIVATNHERASKSPLTISRIETRDETLTNSSISQPIETSMNSSIYQPTDTLTNSSITQPIETSMSSSVSQPIDGSMNSSTNDSVKSDETIEQETSSYPKIPKMIIRNVRSRPGSPLAANDDETEDTKNYAREQRVFEVEIKLERDTNERDSPAECKIPKMKIKLEDKQQPKMILEAQKSASLDAGEQSKNVPKVKIRKVRRSSKSRSPIMVGKLSRQSSDNEIPVEIPETTENSNASGSYKFTLVDRSSSKTHQIGRAERVDEDTRQDRIPKLTIKKQEVSAIGSCGSSSQLKKRRSRSPGESGSKKQRRSAGKHGNGKKDDTRSRERRNNSSDSNETNTDSQSPSEKIPKVIIKRTSPSAEFKCELSKVGREAITKNSKWQPEVKLQRSWVLDCMAMEPGGGKLALRMLETSSESGAKKNSDWSSRRNGDWKRSTSDSTSRITSTSVGSKARRRSDCEFNETEARRGTSDEQRPRTLLVGNCRSKSFDDNINANCGVSREELDRSSAMSRARSSCTKVKTSRTLKILNDDDFEFSGAEEKDELSDGRQDRNNEADSNKSKKSVKNSASFEEPESSVIKLDSSDESQTTIEILPASPLDSQPESLDTNEPSSEVEHPMGNGAMGKLYSDEAIPTQFELELDIVDNSTMDSLDVPVPIPVESSLEEDSVGERANTTEHSQLRRSSDNDENAATDLGCDKFVYDADTRSVSLKKSRRSMDNDGRNICCSDSLVKEVLAAKETLKRCLTKSKSAVVRTKMKPRTKTAAEKKQGTGFDFVGMATYAKTSKCNVEERAVFQDTVKGTKTSEANGCCSEGKSRGERDESFRESDRGDSKQEKMTRESSRKEDKHRKCWSSESRASGRSRDEHASSVTSLKSSKRTSLTSTEIGSTKTNSGKIVEHANLGENSRSKSSSEKSSTDRSLKTNEKSSARLGSSSKVTNNDDPVKKIKSYKIPKISRSLERIGGEEAAAVGEEKRKSPSPTKMPVLEPQIDLSFELAVSDRDTSRSPPVITKQDDRRVDSEVPKKIEDNVNSDKLDSITKQRDSEAVTFADIVSQLAYHEKATIRHRRYCNLCERWFPSTIRHERHLSGYQHRHTELTQRRTVHALFMLFTGKPCPRLLPASIVRTDCLPGEPTPLQIAVQDVAISLEDGARVKPNKDVSSRDE